jgi:SCP-2 sterol transfer family
MTWQGGKLGREVGPVSAFARLKPLATEADDAAKAVRAFSKALGGYQRQVRVHLRLVSGEEGATVEHWNVQAGPKGTAKAEQKEPKQADVIVAMRPETWLLIAQGRLAPYEALYAGKLRVGGDMEIAKAITRHLTDPAATYRAPC